MAEAKIDIVFVGGPHDGQIVEGDRQSLEKWIGRKSASLSLGDDKHLYEIRGNDTNKIVAHYIGKWPNLTS